MRARVAAVAVVVSGACARDRATAQRLAAEQCDLVEVGASVDPPGGTGGAGDAGGNPSPFGTQGGSCGCGYRWKEDRPDAGLVVRGYGPGFDAHDGSGRIEDQWVYQCCVGILNGVVERKGVCSISDFSPM